MSPEQGSNEGNSLSLLSKDKADGFYIVTDKVHNITLLRWNRPLAWFSTMVSKEMLKAFLEIVKDSEEQRQGMGINVSKVNKYRGSYEARNKGF